MEIGASSNSVDYTIDKQYYDGRKNDMQNRVEQLKQEIVNSSEESSDPEVMQLIAQVTGLGKRIDIAI